MIQLTDAQSDRAEIILDIMEEGFIDSSEIWGDIYNAILRRAVEHGDVDMDLKAFDNIASLERAIAMLEGSESAHLATMREEIARKIAATEQGEGYNEEQLPDAILKTLDVLYPPIQRRGIE